MTDEQRTTSANNGLAKGGVSCFVEAFVLKSPPIENLLYVIG
jgi:hypothetical protein